MIEDRGLAPRAAGGRTAALAVARALNALYFLVTSTYCVLTYSSFAYQQFIRPHLVASLTSFVVWHHLWHWVTLGLTALTLVPELKNGRGRHLAWTYLAAMTLLGGVLLLRPILPSVENDALGLRLAFLFLLPPLWLGVYDHVATSARFVPSAIDDRRVLTVAVATAVAVWSMHVAAVPWRLKDLGDLPMSRLDFLFGAATSLLLHVAVFAALAMVLLAALRARLPSSERGVAEYWAVAAVSALVTWLIVARLVFASLSFRGSAALLLAGLLALTLAATWSGIARRVFVCRAGALSALDAWFAPLPWTASRRAAWLAIAILPLAAYATVERVATFDWDFLVQSLSIVGVWLLAFACLHGAFRARVVGRLRPAPVILAAGVLLTTGAARGSLESGLSGRLARPPFVPEFALDAYAAVDPSYRLIRHLLWVDPPGSASFFQQLRANSLIQHVPIDPIDVDFVARLGAAPVKPPHVFLFVIDSLRRDYVSAYNPAVTFTPSIGRFAAESDTFMRAFSRYGGTGLSMPAIWTGGMLLHKEYVLPFQPMNALDKLLEENRYRKLISLDHITAQLIDPNGVEELDRGRDEMQYDFCATLGELQSKLAGVASTGRPVFAHTRSLNLHVSKLTNRSLALDGAYEGFQGPAAAAIGRMDRCFGGFIDFLKGRGLYDDSVVILTSDHGDSLGEAKRWGHSYTIFPEIVRVPLIIHVPARLRAGMIAAADAASFSTDITPTVYALLGYMPRAPGWAYGAPLFVPAGGDQSGRRHETVLVASSYGPVYGLVQQNGESLYIADGVNGRDYAYDLSQLRPARVGVTKERREESRTFISARLVDLAAMYHFTPQP